jgi:hypothetical protein
MRFERDHMYLLRYEGPSLDNAIPTCGLLYGSRDNVIN